MEVDGWLYLIGRAKECINRGGELLSPAEIEAVLEGHPAIAEVMAFSSPHATLGEIVAIALPADSAVSDIAELRDWAVGRLALTQLPQVLVHVPELPRTHGTRKLQRIGYAKLVGMPTVAGGALYTYKFEPAIEHRPGRLLCLDEADSARAIAQPPSGHATRTLGGLVEIIESIKKQMYRHMRTGQEQHTGSMRVKRAASGTAKFTMHMRYLAHCLGFGSDDLARHFLPLFWRSEWPEEWERAYTSAMVLCFRQHGRLPTEETSIWSEIFKAEVRAGVGGACVRTLPFPSYCTLSLCRVLAGECGRSRR